MWLRLFGNGKSGHKTYERDYIYKGVFWDTRSVIEQDFSLLPVSKDMLYRDLLELTSFGAEKQISDEDEGEAT
ncbi:hypothetical protein Asppvi_004690 [Aspergillus pseudoviridinutans]|uniref:Uncharacterized protein n=1 Tax=Aspergillus pseudoviridinutans TaxID=1517512 RepID=A0A9P3ERY8_9EURO|nr:uncharacterized protein Asppvi_004690 [Aspergillus pseudoviridinutans]GIJ85826.1 hypothetical protein Asppvi_004690 [Aspergillus pseudoviridinutans]